MKRVVLVGMPNTGKSTFFNRVTGASARVGNWPGITVDLLAAKLPLGGAMVELVDLPGVYDLHGFSDDERIEQMFDAIDRAGRNQQVIVLTCRARSFASLGGRQLQIT